MWFWKKKEEVKISDIIETVVQDGKTFDVFYMEIGGKKYWHFWHEGKVYELVIMI